MDYIYLENVRKHITTLIPNTVIKHSKIAADSIDIFDGKKGLVCCNGTKVSSKRYGNIFEVYLQSVSSNYVHLLKIEKAYFDFTHSEIKLLKKITKAIRSTNNTSADKIKNIPQTLEADCSFPLFIIAQLMRGDCEYRWSTPIFYLRLLQNLTFQTYEGAKCTSGFICVTDFKNFISAISKNNRCTFNKFDMPIVVQEDFFSMPTSYRYIDGRNSFYVCDRAKNVYGVLNFKNPQEFSLYDRCDGEFIQDILRLNYCKWIAYVGYSNDVVLYVHEYPQIKWERNQWKLREKQQLIKIFLENGCTEEFSKSISQIIFTLSELHMGSLILITDREVPKAIGKIDESILGHELYKVIEEQNCKELKKTNKILRILSSDGLTAFDKNGEILECGSIIDLSSSPEHKIVGGGRTQAAKKASEYGIAIKVSEDGPITVFKNNENIIKL